MQDRETKGKPSYQRDLVFPAIWLHHTDFCLKPFSIYQNSVSGELE